jgi:hypothetical protein
VNAVAKDGSVQGDELIADSNRTPSPASLSMLGLVAVE